MSDATLEVGGESINMGALANVPNVGTTPPPGPPNGWKDELQRIADAHRVRLSDIMSDRRTRPVAYARFEAMSRLKDRNWSLPKIGRTLGGRDHTTALHGIRRFKELVAEGKITPVVF